MKFKKLLIYVTILIFLLQFVMPLRKVQAAGEEENQGFSSEEQIQTPQENQNLENPSQSTESTQPTESIVAPEQNLENNI